MFKMPDYLNQLPEGTTAKSDAARVHISGDFVNVTYESAHTDIGADIALFMRTPKQPSVKEQFRGLAKRLCAEHPAISTDEGIFGGMPHIREVRLSVGDILSKLYVYGSVQAILDIYAPDIDEDQIKEAIAYAQDFLETACDPRQPHQANG